MTVRVHPGVPSLRSARFVGEFESSLRVGCERGNFRVTHYSIQRDHLHLIVEACDPQALGRGMKALAARLGWIAKRAFGHRGPMLADRYHVHVLRTPREARNAIVYVLLNAKKHAMAAGRREAPRWVVDPASSGRWFESWRESVPEADDPPAVAAAGTWLLRTGWKRHGAISVSEIPGRLTRDPRPST